MPAQAGFSRSPLKGRWQLGSEAESLRCLKGPCHLKLFKTDRAKEETPQMSITLHTRVNTPTCRQTLPAVPCGQTGKRAVFLAGGLLRFLLWSLGVRSTTQCHLLLMPSITRCFAARQTQKTAKGARPVQQWEGGRRAAQRGSALSPRPHCHLSPHVLKLTQNTQPSRPWDGSVGARPPRGSTPWELSQESCPNKPSH